MRVTDSSLYNQIQQGLAVRNQSLAQAQTRAVTGKRVLKPSDDPAASAQARIQTAQESRAIAQGRSVEVAATSLQVANSALDSAADSFSRISELALQALNGLASTEDRAHAASEIASLRDQLVGLGNTQEAGHYVFGGYNDADPPFLANGTYRGGTQAQSVEVAKNVRVATGVTGDHLFQAPGGPNLFGVIDSLLTALRSDNIDGIRAAIDPLNGGATQVRLARTEIAGHLAATEVARSVVQRVKDQAVTTRAALVDMDVIQSYSDLARAQAALEGAISIASQLPPPGLVTRARVG